MAFDPKDWQTAISAGVGFLGIICTLLTNAAIARSAQRKVQKDRRESVLKYIKAHLELALDDCRQQKRSMESKEPLGNLLVPKDPVFTFSIDLLTKEPIDIRYETFIAIGEAYAQSLNWNKLPTLLNAPIDREYMLVSDIANSRKILIAFYKAIIDSAERAIAAINIDLGIEKAPPAGASGAS